MLTWFQNSNVIAGLTAFAMATVVRQACERKPCATAYWPPCRSRP